MAHLRTCPTGHERKTQAIVPSVTAAAKKVSVIHEKKKEREEDVSERDPTKSLMKRRRDEFLEKGMYTALYGMLERKVQCASMCTDHLLNQKRDRLRKLLLSEEENYAKEYVALCQAANQAKAEELRKKANEIKSKQEFERQQLAEMKIREMKIQDCEPARPYRTKKALLMVKQDQLWQIKEKYALEEARREEERMYHDLMIRNMLEMKERDEENAKAQWMKQKEAKETFIEQMKWKEMREEKEKAMKEFEKKQIEEIAKTYRAEEEKEIEEKRKRNAQQIAEYQAYMERERKIRERRDREEMDIDKAYNRLMQIEEERERNKLTSNKEKLRRDMDNYLQSCKELQRLRDLEERRNDELLEELNRKIAAQQDANRARLRAAKRELFTNVLREREEQVREKREKERREEEARNNEIDLLNRQIEQQRKIREEYERRSAEKRQEYGRQLKEQMREFEEAKNRRKREEEEYINQVRLGEERRLQEINDILDNSISLPMHPMKEYIITNPPCFPCLR